MKQAHELKTLARYFEADRREGTPGPWWTDSRYNEDEMGCHIIAASADCSPPPGNPTRGMVAWASEILNTEARRCEANARRIANVPKMEDWIIAAAARIEELEARINALTEQADLEFKRGYMIACCNYDNLFDQPTCVAEILGAADITAADVKAMDLCEYDIKALRKIRKHGRDDPILRRPTGEHR